ncbi:aliphatic sulfonate ABC transporter substrate-binding protein [Caballeronia udeis]|uniref:Aliphatic sulfonate ABC transporter substrate-binding protein n=1 Tax=Caballeronia udeis TaxID=1232866 RepID=A0A158J4R4_9BURK|nr:ABC transporter substrate-binding protein [Caballeronia udeis]SAL63453.1 aliphatic sulfonate ABC transporter substrate-binding protein [Caballeronia udeis]
MSLFKFLSAVCFAFSLTTASQVQAQNTVTVGIANTSADAGVLIAKENGYFKDEGIDVKLVPFASAALMIAPLATGELDVGSGTASAGLYNAVLRSVKIKVVADKGSVQEGYDYSTLLIRKDLVDSGRYKTFADLKGMTVAVAAKGAGSESALNEALKKGGLTMHDVNVVYLGFPDHLVALENKKIDASITDEPTITRAIEGAIAVKASPKAIYPGQQNAVVVYSDKFMKDRDQATRFMIAYIRAVRFYNDALSGGRLAGPTSSKVIDILIKNTKIKDAGFYRRITPAATNPNGSVNEVALANDLKYFKARGYVSGNIEVSDVVDDSFAAAAVAKLGPYKPLVASN